MNLTALWYSQVETPQRVGSVVWVSGNIVYKTNTSVAMSTL